MPNPPIDVDKGHRWFAIEFNNQCWGLLEKEGRDAADNEKMVHMAHAALLHWSFVGNDLNRQRALVLLANVHSTVGHGSVAVEYAETCETLSKKISKELADFDWAFMYECVARAHACNGSTEEAKSWKAKAREAGDKIADPEDKKIFDDGFAKGNWHGV